MSAPASPQRAANPAPNRGSNPQLRGSGTQLRGGAPASPLRATNPQLRGSGTQLRGGPAPQRGTSPASPQRVAEHHVSNSRGMSPQGGTRRDAPPSVRTSTGGGWTKGSSTSALRRSNHAATGNARMEALFKEFDDDNSGFISAVELREALQRKFGIILDHDNAMLLLQRCDENGDGEIDYTEFCDVIELVLEMKNQFDATDVDGSKAINTSELYELMEKLGMSITKEMTEVLVQIFDDDGSGEIEYQEFFNLMLYAKELEYQYLKRYKQQKHPTEFQWVTKLLGQSAADPQLIQFLQKNKNVTLSQFTGEVITSLHRNKTRQRAPRVVKVRKARKKAPKRVIRAPKLGQVSTLRRATATANYTKENPFCDASFAPNSTSLGKLAGKVANWKRPREISSNPRLFVDGVEEGDVVQGNLGNCWFLGALSVIASSGNEFIEQSFVQSDFNGGRHVCKFCKDGDWVEVEVDDRIPCSANGKPAFASCKDENEFWVPIIEKAYAKLHGGYQMLESGTLSYALKDLTGEAVEQLNLTEPDTLPCELGQGPLWNLFTENIAESFLMGCSINSPVAMAEEKNGFGLLLNHAYSIIDCQKVHGHELIRLRNPWGSFEWTGRWSDGAPEWTPDLMKHFGNYEFDNDGTFFMCFEDFLQFFNSVTVLRLLTDDVGEVWEKYTFQGDWDANHAGGCLSFPTWPKNPQYKICASRPNTRVFACLSQSDLRYKKSTARYESFGMTVIKGDVRSLNNNKKVTINESEKLKTSIFFSGRDVSLEFTVRTVGDNGHVILVPSFFNANVQAPYTLLVYMQYPGTIELLTENKLALSSGNSRPFGLNIGTPKPSRANLLGGSDMNGQWIGASAGGCLNHPTWLYNPQYILTCTNPCDCTITLTQDNGMNPPETIGMYLFEASKLHFRRLGDPRVSPGEKIQFINQQSVSITLKMTDKDKPLLLMPATFEPGRQLNFSLSAACTSGTASIVPAKSWNEGGKQGEWTKGHAGGCMNHRQWEYNPIFWMTLSGNAPQTLSVCIAVPSLLQSGIGFYLFSDKQGTGNPTLLGLIGNSPFSKTLSNVFTFKDLAPGRYIILPCTFDPAYYSSFSISVLGSIQYKLEGPFV